MIQAKIICDSLGPNQSRLTTFVLTFPRFILPEFLTHRAFSRNASSSRAIPTKRLIRNVWENPATPVSFGQNKSGMSADTEVSPVKAWIAKNIWLLSGYAACCVAWCLSKLGVHKQVVNRLIEPWTHITVIATATNLTNFFALRLNKGAQPEFQVLAYKMLEEYLRSQPKILHPGEWHIPFGDKIEGEFTAEERIQIATARCARVSYLNFEGNIDHIKDFGLHNTLVDEGHMSPTEHVAQCLGLFETAPLSNLTGWRQYRKQFPNENISDTNLESLLKKGHPYENPMEQMGSPQ